MSLEHVKTFYEKLAKDERFRAQVQGATSKDEYSQIVKTAGYDFTPEEFEEYTLQLLESTANEGEIQDLSEKELAAVVGGATAGIVGSIWPYMVAIYGLPPRLFLQ
ncbi:MULTISPECIES: Nif11-like leader peptide family natural product precursor [unclassified Nodularia (in: cyanobacteria)]|uniref:Nif11-like leader peptide family natural product precursor n=1 Tax=unclassified Nodularia (in: cyanobacteria) TaxID=2656917 RepID=UPI001881C464|nr:MULTISPECIES: Nif11-like leader peptide family natural product precursor [unclassified Nodularia (in: cyanobacteria)]MBE9197514.1 Nif11-like leader peptide family natural product precursor [Nodularia sp. LEGE 06071]MCC2694373.1 Nif11-like leader peptide family natural product precursor [Nodularia sp. LEGE 04288]